MIVQKLIQQLQEIEKLEGESHRLWDHAMMNMRSGMSDEHRQKMLQLTYEATRLHSQAMDILRSATKDCRESSHVFDPSLALEFSKN